jgi:NAD(P) transhydrogenase
VKRFDWVVIGGGPAGEKGAVQAAYFGKRVALVERAPYLGGAAVNTGTLPSKTLRETCLHLSGFRQRGLGDVAQGSPQDLTVDQLMGRARAVSESERKRMTGNLGRHGVEIIRGAARFAEAHAVDVEESEGGGTRRIEGEKFLIATGSSPFRPAGIDFQHPLIDDSDEFLQLDRVPESLTVMGGGVIGCEYATMFAALGVRVVLIDPRADLLPFVDREIVECLLETMRDGLDIDLRLGRKVTEVVPFADRVECRLEGGGSVSSQRLLVAAGRVGNTAGLGLEAIGLAANARGLIEVGEHYVTALPHVYAVGDVIGFPALASVAMEQARVAAVHAFGLGYKDRVAPLLPYGIYTIPELSMIGESEESARAAGLDVEVGRASYASNARGQIIGDRTGLVKLVFRRDDKRLVGAAVVGENAAELIHVASAVLQLGGTIDAFIDMVFNYPTLSDIYKYAAYDGLGRLAGRPGPSSVTTMGA